MKIDQSYLSTINEQRFTDIALSVFQYQYEHNSLYRQYVQALGIRTDNITHITQIPFLPISFFKSHTVLCGNHMPSLYFESSGTTGDTHSRHYILDPLLYQQSLLAGFESFYGSLENYAVVALLPSYLERGNASLVHMAKEWMAASGHPQNGFYLNEWEALAQTLRSLEEQQQPTLLIGVTFALLDFAEQYPIPLQHTIVMETGGMKGRKKEITRTAVHDFLKAQWQLEAIHSEYGMTELLSQAYAKANGLFVPTSTMKVGVRDINDPLAMSATGNGLLNIIDLANIHSCSFIATEDIGRVFPDGSFEVLGRMDHSALRGCSLMAV